MASLLRIGTRESQLAVWQATLVQQYLTKNNFPSELVLIKSDGDIDLKTPLYEMGVQGIFTKSLDMALLAGKIDIAVHSMKDVPTQLPAGIAQAAVLERASFKDLLVYKGDCEKISKQLSGESSDGPVSGDHPPFTIATSSIRRRAQWLNRYPGHTIENLRGNVNSRLRKLQEHNWNGAIFAAAGLERIGLRPANAIDLNWMLPAPAQGAIMVVCREADQYSLEACSLLNHSDTAICTKIERDFLRTLMGGCSTPISALANITGIQLSFKGNILSPDGKSKLEVEKIFDLDKSVNLGIDAAKEILSKGADKIADIIRDEK